MSNSSLGDLMLQGSFEGSLNREKPRARAFFCQSTVGVRAKRASLVLCVRSNLCELSSFR